MKPALRKIFALSASAALLASLSACGGSDDDDDAPPSNALKGATLDVAILGTTDLHANVLGYDYYKLAEDKSYGVDRTATLIAEARKQNRTRCCSTTATPSGHGPVRLPGAGQAGAVHGHDRHLQADEAAGL